MAPAQFNNLVKELFNDFSDLLFPRLCAGCEGTLFLHEKFICDLCAHRLPVTGFWKLKDNPVERVFWGRVRVHKAHSFLFFRKGSITQSLLHEIKYRNNDEAAAGMGLLYGQEYNKWLDLARPDLIIPVPLHPSKLLSRGFNQSERIARGFSEATSIPLDTVSLIRRKATVTQTKKERWNRVENMQEVFQLREEHPLKGKHVLLFDDVITTGATAEACILSLSAVSGIKVSFASLACA